MYCAGSYMVLRISNVSIVRKHHLHKDDTCVSKTRLNLKAATVILFRFF